MKKNRPQQFFVIGDPIAHSQSPKLHRACIEACGLTASYLPIKISPHEIGPFVDFLRQFESFSGLNVTLPLKEAIIDCLDGLDDVALAVGAVNCVYRKNHRLIGFNMDAVAFSESITTKFPFSFRGKRALLLGAGGSSRALLYEMGRLKVAHVVVCNRNAKRAKNLIGAFSKVFPNTCFTYAPFKKLSPKHGPFHLIVHATSLTSNAGSSSLPMTSFSYDQDTIFFDLNYGADRSIMSHWLQDKASHLAGNFMDGKDMLVRQAAKSFSLWQSQPYPKVLKIMSAVKI